MISATKLEIFAELKVSAVTGEVIHLSGASDVLLW
jgi:hypothetical protein